MKHRHLLHPLAPAATALTGLLCACGGSPAPKDSGPQVTVTVTPTVTASPPTATTSSAPAAPKSDDKGRAYDFGVVRKASTVGGTAVIELDRWTWKGVDDAKLAKDGVPTAPFKGKPPYENQNAKLTYTIPVTEGARILLNHCVAADQPLQTKSVPAKALVDLPDRENTVLVQLDDQGRLTAAQNIPGCPS